LGRPSIPLNSEFTPKHLYLAIEVHIRRGDVILEAMALLDFVEWAFGPDGFPRLEIVAYGEFSHHNRYRRQGIIVSRVSDVESNASNSIPHATDEFPLFPIMDDMDSGALEEFYSENEFLEACPVESLLEISDAM
jgi:hypothetical protein